MPKKLFIHIGPRKTATTTIQRLLSEHGNGIVIYPRVGYQGHRGHHGFVYKVFGEGDRDQNLGDLDGMLRAVAQQTSDSGRNVIFSSESLESRDVGEFVRRVLPFTGCSEVDVEVLVACREHFGRAASLYSHRLSQAAIANQRSPDEYLAKSAAKFCYAPLLQRLRDTGLRIIALNYHPSSTWVGRFMQHVGFRDEDIPAVPSALVSLSPKIIIANLAIKRIAPSGGAVGRYLRAFRKMPESRTESKFIFSPAAAAIAEPCFAEDRAYLLREFGIELPAPDLAAGENALYITPLELAQIVAVAAQFGTVGKAIVDFARQYVKECA